MDRAGEIEATMLRLVAERGAAKTVCPSEVARALGGPGPEDWRRLMQPVRRVAVRLVGEGRVAILRGGVPVGDPEVMRGIYRLGTPRAGGDRSSSTTGSYPLETPEPSSTPMRPPGSQGRSD